MQGLPGCWQRWNWQSTVTGPLLLERGKPVAQRIDDVQRFWQRGEFDPNSNVQFGEGGAGTFSDGKLTTRVNDPVMGSILQDFVKAGAPQKFYTNTSLM